MASASRANPEKERGGANADAQRGDGTPTEGGRRWVMTEGVLRLGQVEARTLMLDVVCSHCDRRGCLSTARLVERHGPDLSMPALLDLLTADCPRRNSGGLYQACGAHFPQLPALFGK